VRLLNYVVISLAFVGVAFLISLPIVSKVIAEKLAIDRPAALPAPPQVLPPRKEPAVPVDELNKALRLPKVDTTPTDEHSQRALDSYYAGDYERAFQEAVLSLDPTPLEENPLYRVLTSTSGNELFRRVEKPNGRQAIEPIDAALQPILSKSDPQNAARLNNAAAMLILYFYTRDMPFPSDYLEAPSEPWVAKELAHQAADLQPSYCPALLNLTFFDGMAHGSSDGQQATFFGTDYELDPAGKHYDPNSSVPSAWTNHYPAKGCKEPALLYYRAQDAIGQVRQNEFGGDSDGLPGTSAIDEALRLANRLQADPQWAGLAHSVKGDAYYWSGIYAVERTLGPRPFTAKHSFELALQEYDMALALQPDDPAIRHGKALAYLELGKAETSDNIDTDTLNKAVHETEAVLQWAPGSQKAQQTRIKAYEEKGDYATAARLQRDSLSGRQLAPKSLTLVPYSPISHGSDLYSELRVLPITGGGAGVALTDDEVIVPFISRPYVSSVDRSGWGWSAPNGLDQYRTELRNYGLLRDELLSDNCTTMISDFEVTPEEVRQNPRTLLLSGLAQLLCQPEGSVTPLPKTQDTIEKASTSLQADYYSTSKAYYPGEAPLKDDDIFYREAGNFFRQYKQYRNAIRVYEIWRTELERDGADKDRQAEVEKLLGESYFLNGNDEAAFAAFGRAAELRPGWPPYTVRQAFMHEQREEYGEAAALYQKAWQAMQKMAEWMPQELEPGQPPWASYSPDNYQAVKHLGDVLLKQAENASQVEDENAQTDRGQYADAAQVFRAALLVDLTQQTYTTGTQVPSTAAAVNNLGIALLMAKDYQGSIRVLETLVLPEVTSREDKVSDAEILKILAGPLGVPDPDPNHASPPAPDDSNPIFHLNLGWAYELNDEPKKAKDQYLAAIRSNPTFHPALNDLGVLAAEQGNLDEAKGYFRAALEAKPDYAYASYNLGVALLRSGPQSFLGAQHYLGEAVRQDTSLVDKPYDYVFDNDLYFLKLSLGDRVPADWTFVKEAQRSTLEFSLVVVMLLLWRIMRTYALTKSRETIIGKAFDWVRARLGARLLRFPTRLRHVWLGFQRLGLLTPSRWWVSPLALLISALAVVVVQCWSLLWESSPYKLLVLAIALCLSLVSLLVHHAGHALAALRYRMQVQEAPWPAGIAQAVVLAAIKGPAFAPMPAASVSGEGDRRQRSFVYLAGPLASLSFAALLYALFFWSYIPMLHFGIILNLAMASASLLLMPPLDAAKMDGDYNLWTFWAGILVLGLTALVSTVSITALIPTSSSPESPTPPQQQSPTLQLSSLFSSPPQSSPLPQSSPSPPQQQSPPQQSTNSTPESPTPPQQQSPPQQLSPQSSPSPASSPSPLPQAPQQSPPPGSPPESPPPPPEPSPTQQQYQ
jgi:tetratricopeptide (TPR) repeat protein